MADEEHEHMCMSCGRFIDCDDGDDCEDFYKETLCTACLKEQEELVREENAL